MLREYLETLNQFKPNICDFILLNGEERSGSWSLPGYPAKECYKNAYLIASKYPQRYTYAEGYAWQHDLIPLPHAWNVDVYGHVLDVTWTRDVDCDYYGVEFPLWYVCKILLTNKYHGSLLDNYLMRWPLITGKHQYEDIIKRNEGDQGISLGDSRL